jgi:hypothetical protein
VAPSAGRSFSALPLLVSAVTPFRYPVLAAPPDPRTRREFLAGDWRFRLSPALLLARLFQLRGVDPYYQLVWPGAVSTNARLFETSERWPSHLATRAAVITPSFLGFAPSFSSSRLRASRTTPAVCTTTYATCKSRR